MEENTNRYTGKSIYGMEFRFDSSINAQFMTVITYQVHGELFTRTLGIHETWEEAEEVLTTARNHQPFIDNGAMTEVVTLTRQG